MTAIQDLIARVESLEKRLPLPITSPASANFYTFRSVEDAETAEKMRNDAILAERERYAKLLEEYVLSEDDSGGEPVIWNRAIDFAADLIRRRK